MLGRSVLWRHAVLGLVVLVFSVLGFAGVIGARHAERFEAKTVFVQPVGTDGVRITEVVDQDFGSNDRRGLQRIIPNDFGVPTGVQASSPDANAEVTVLRGPGRDETTIRVGSPDETFDGQHRYVLSYTLPEARLSSGELALDIIGNEETLETGSFSVVLVGMQLADPTCNTGSFGATGGCTLEPDGDTLRTTIAPLPPHDGITIGGTITGLDEAAALPEFPPLPERRADHRMAVGLILLGSGLLVAAVMYVVIRRLGRNEVAAGGAADAAYAVAGQTTTLVPDDRMDRLATTEFVPPTGIAPWQGTILLREEIGTGSVSAWFSEWIAKEALVIDDEGATKRLRAGPRFEQVLDAPTKALLGTVLGGDGIVLGTYDPQFAALWSTVKRQQATAVSETGWWRRMPPGGASGAGATTVMRIVAIVVVFALFAGGGLLRSNLLGNAAAAVVACIVIVGGLAAGLYWFMLRSRSAVGSGLAIRTESFRRFLEASEGQHVDWAWQHGVLREYSAWAVALGAADAWGRALATSHVPPAELSVGNPLLMASLASSFTSTMTAPSSSGSGGGGGGFSGGFSGGSVGGGGGGGSSGSW